MSIEDLWGSRIQDNLWPLLTGPIYDNEYRNKYLSSKDISNLDFHAPYLFRRHRNFWGRDCRNFCHTQFLADLQKFSASFCLWPISWEQHGPWYFWDVSQHYRLWRHWQQLRLGRTFYVCYFDSCIWWKWYLVSTICSDDKSPGCYSCDHTLVASFSLLGHQTQRNYLLGYWEHLWDHFLVLNPGLSSFCVSFVVTSKRKIWV